MIEYFPSFQQHACVAAAPVVRGTCGSSCFLVAACTQEQQADCFAGARKISKLLTVDTPLAGNSLVSMAATDIKLFGKWSYEEDEVKVRQPPRGLLPPGP